MLQALVPLIIDARWSAARGVSSVIRFGPRLRARVPRGSYVVDNAETGFVNRGRVANEPGCLLPRHFHVQERRVSVAHVRFHFCDAITGCDECLRQFLSLFGEERRNLKPEGKTLLDGNAKVGPQPASTKTIRAESGSMRLNSEGSSFSPSRPERRPSQLQ